MSIIKDGKKVNIRSFKITSAKQLNEIERKYRDLHHSQEYFPWATGGTPFQEIAENIFPDAEGEWVTPLRLVITDHRPMLGINNALRMTNDFLEQLKQSQKIDVLSISAGMENNEISVRTLVRAYDPSFNLFGLFDYTGDKMIEELTGEEDAVSGNLVIPDEIKNFKYSESEIKQHDQAYKVQREIFDHCDKTHPFLNQLKSYTPVKLPRPEDHMDLIYDLQTSDMRIETIAPYDEFTRIFRNIMSYVNGPERYTYISVLHGEQTEEFFMGNLENYVRDNYIRTGELPVEDLHIMMTKLYRGLFQLYVIQDLIDDPDVTDIKITAPDSIRARVKGKAYISNISFIDEKDYLRFIDMVSIRNMIKMNVPTQTFTDSKDENYIMRFSLTAGYVTPDGMPTLHIRKVPRKKLLGNDLIAAGMFDEKIRDYLLDCGKNSRGVVFSGMPGSGKTVCLNWFFEEAYEQSAEILVIQENDELFAYRKGVMFQHVVDFAPGGEQAVDLEGLGKLALVAGVNVLVIGEAKGAEICSAITLSNSGCRTAITIHSNSSTETIDKMADLAQRGFAQSYDQAKRNLRSFQTIVFLKDFKVQEISEITGYDETKHDMTYRYIYRRDAEVA